MKKFVIIPAVFLLLLTAAAFGIFTAQINKTEQAYIKQSQELVKQRAETLRMSLENVESADDIVAALSESPMNESASWLFACTDSEILLVKDSKITADFLKSQEIANAGAKTKDMLLAELKAEERVNSTQTVFAGGMAYTIGVSVDQRWLLDNIGYTSLKAVSYTALAILGAVFYIAFFAMSALYLTEVKRVKGLRAELAKLYAQAEKRMKDKLQEMGRSSPKETKGQKVLYVPSAPALAAGGVAIGGAAVAANSESMATEKGVPSVGANGFALGGALEQYEYKYYLTIHHAIQHGGVRGDIHSHTWEVDLILRPQNTDDIVQFTKVEKKIQEQFAEYQNKFLNDIQPFDEVTPTLENVCEYFIIQFEDVLGEVGFDLIKFGISESPTRNYALQRSAA